MYEPRFTPQIDKMKDPLLGVRFVIERSNRYQHPGDPEADPLHVHNYLEIFINISSDVSFLVNNKLYSVPYGDAVICCPNDIHMGVFHKSAVQEHVCIWIEADFSSPVFSFLRKPDFCPLFCFDEQSKTYLHSLVFSLLDMYDREGGELEKLSSLLLILSVFEKKNNADTFQENVPVEMQKILSDIHENFCDIHSVNDILSSHFVSSSTLTRWFRKYLKISPKEHLESVKLSNAAVLLEKGYSVTDACMLSGFSDCSHFISLFKKKYGETPFRYKKRIGHLAH